MCRVGSGDSLLSRRHEGGGEESEEGEENQERLEDRDAGEDVTEGAYGEQEYGDGWGEGGFVLFCVRRRICQRRRRK